jgi:hypothetical protein
MQRNGISVKRSEVVFKNQVYFEIIKAHILMSLCRPPCTISELIFDGFVAAGKYCSLKSYA